MSDFISRWFSDDFVRNLEVAFAQKESVGVLHWFSDDVSHRLPDDFIRRLANVFVRKLPDDVLQWHLDTFLQRHTDDVSQRLSSYFLWWLLCFFFREEAGVLSQNEPKVFVPTRWDEDYTRPDVLKKQVDDSKKRLAAWQKRAEAARERLDYFSQWFSDDFLQRFLDVLLQSPTDALLPWLSNLAEWDEEVAQEIWENYYDWLVRFSLRKLEKSRVSRSDYDEEDVASDAMCDFYKGIKKHQFQNLHCRDNLRKLLFTITTRKVNDRLKQCFTQKRGNRQVLILEEPDTKNQPIFATIATLGIESKDEDKQGGLASIPDKKQRTPEEELIDAEQFLLGEEKYQQMIEQLPNEELRQIATLMMDGGSAVEIADTLRCTDETVRNKRNKIRDNLLVKLMGTEPTPQRADEVVKKYRSLLDTLGIDRRTIAESWLKGDTPQEIAQKLGRTPTAIYRELLRIARIWENSR